MRCGARVGLRNPYTPGGVPRYFVGRVEELGLVRDRLRRVVEDGEMADPTLVFTAPRGLGKTSLLRVARDEARAQGLAVAWVSCVKDTPFLPDLHSAVAKALREVDAAAGGERAGRLESLEVEIGLPGARVAAGVRTGAQEISPPAGAVSAVEDLLHEAATAARDRGGADLGAGLLVVIDELHACPLVETAVLLNAIQNLAGDRDQNPLAIVAAGLPSTPGHLTRAATFGERSQFAPLPRLDQRTAADVLVAPAAAVGVPWSTQALAAVEGAADGFPYFLQLLGAATWDAAEPEAGTTLTADHVRAGASRARAQVVAMFQARWEAATALEREFMQAMADNGDDQVPRARIAAAMNRSTEAISLPRDRLIDKGIIEPAGRGLLRFTLPGFAAYARGEDVPPAITAPADLDDGQTPGQEPPVRPATAPA